MEVKPFTAADISELKRLSQLCLSDNVQAFLDKKTAELETLLPQTISVPVKTKTDELCCKKLKNYGWDQTDSAIKFYITIPKPFEKNDVQVEVTDKSVKIVVKTDTEKYELQISQLFGTVLSDKYQLKTKGLEVGVTLTKEKSGKWECLCASDVKPKPQTPDLGMDKDADPGSGIMKMMQKMYNEGDDEMKRTIQKAWTQSQDKQKQGIDPIT
uniref:Calcyclin-binding protein (Trinotate prediction) n=1 Tax=Myxobolus squamalis TaxID=59785 RepID=A0A6B2G2M2_MYXSQ